ncbi:MAG: hypothetical protein AAF901_07440 [Bacteroidota bacterium]
MKYKIIFFVSLLSFFWYSNVMAQFQGSNGDGFDNEFRSAITLDNTSLAILYEGSNGDGYDNSVLSATTLDNTSLAVLYDGSNGDGFDRETLSAITLENTPLFALYSGSNGDGFDRLLLSATTLENTPLFVLYEGSNGDGFDNEFRSAITLDNTSLAILYEGSNGDGFDLRSLVNTTLLNTNLAVLYDGGNGDGFDIDLATSFLDPNAVVDLRLAVKVKLQGATINPTTMGLMNDILRADGMLPLISPYLDSAAVNSTVFNQGGTSGTGLSPDDIVDWVWIEIRSNVDNLLFVDGTSALLQRDGDVVALDGVSDIILRGVTNSYYVVVNHRNHNGIMSNLPLALNTSPTTINFINGSVPTFGSNAQVELPGKDFGLWAGNVNNDFAIQYSGTDADSPSILSQVLNDPNNVLNFPTFISNGYLNTDVNMDGKTQYTGTNPDTPILLQNVLSHPENFLNFSTFQIQEQLPEN